MPRVSSVPPARLAGVLVTLGGMVAGVGAIGVAAGGVGNEAARAGVALEASHLPPLLTVPGEKVTLAYDAFCVPSGPLEDVDTEGNCQVTGSVFARAGASGPFSELRLTASSMHDGHVETEVPAQLAQSRTGFSYFAVLHEGTSDATVTVPAGGAAAPLVSLPLEEPVRVDLGRHAFDQTLRPEERVATAAWGTGPDEAGLEQGRRSTPIGASAFDVGRDGTVYLLDETHHRMLVWKKSSHVPDRVQLGVAGTLADMTAGSNGTIYVLETVPQAGRTPLVRHFDADGRQLEAVETAERTASEIRLGPLGPVVLQQPAQQWMPLNVTGAPAGAATQRRRAHAGRPLPTGGEVVVLRRGREIRVALVGASGARRGWILTSDTDIAEVQLAEPVGDRLLLVLRLYTDDRDEFAVVLLDRRGLVQRFSVDALDWAESAPLGRFKLVGSSLYRLGSTPAGVFVDRFELEVR